MQFYVQTEELTAEERALRDAFVEQFYVDFNTLNACLRLGMSLEVAQTFSVRFMTEPYVQKQLQKYQQEQNLSTEKEVERDRALVINALRQAAQHGPYATRVTASAKLAELRGFTAGEGDDPAQKLIDAFKVVAQSVQ